MYYLIDFLSVPELQFDESMLNTKSSWEWREGKRT